MAEWCRFTAPEGGARLAASARRRNTLAVELGAFTGTRLLVERAHAHRGTLSSGAERSIFISRASRVACAAYELNILTSLSVTQALEYTDVDWREELEVKEVVVCTSAVLRRILQDELLTMTQINVLIIDSCHLIHTDEDLQTIMKLYKQSPKQPRILALTYPLFTTKRPEKVIENQQSESLEERDVDEKGDGNNESQPVTNPAQLAVSPDLDDFEMYSKLEWTIEALEHALSCRADLAEDIDGGKRFSSSTTKPKELIVEYSPRREVCADYEELEAFMRATVRDALDWLDEHRYDPTEIYGEELYEEFMNIPNPTIDPKDIFRQFLYVLDELGPYGADKAAFSLLTKVEKLKIKVPYERHFLLLCLCTTVFVKIRCYADLIFSKYSDLDRINEFSTPKVLRFIEILAQFEGPEIKEDEEKAEDKKLSENKCQSETSVSVKNYSEMNGISNSKTNNETDERLNSTNELLNVIEKCDFISLSNKIEDKINTYEANLKEIDSELPKCEVDSKSVEVYSNILKADSKSEVDFKISDVNSVPESELDSDPRSVLGLPKRAQRARGRGRVQRNINRNQLAPQNPDALCGIVFMNEPIMAKILFLLVVELSRSEPRLARVCAQHCAAAAPGDGADMRRQCRAREDALKKFRMHDCNLLLATPELEEGIDLPRCNLVLRWDVPPSYRSHGLCRARARAPRAACVLLSRAETPEAPELLRRVATYRHLDEIISKKCGCGIQDEPSQAEEDHADTFTPLIQPYTPAIPCVKDAEQDKHTPELEAENLANYRDQNDDLVQPYINCIKEEIVKHIQGNETERTAENNIHINSITDKVNELTCHDNAKVDSDVNLICNKCGEVRTSVDECCAQNIDKDHEKKEDIPSVDLSSAIALINRYCGKLPSDTFTRLAPSWRTERVRVPARLTDKQTDEDGMVEAWVCTLRLPLNCPVKYNIVGHPMPTRALARRMAALQACRVLHRSGELDDQLTPIGKENFKAAELDTGCLDGSPDARPGTTKRRQYYYKRTARAFTNCEPVVDSTDEQIDEPPNNCNANILYAISCTLWCALPERYNTRGRRLHAPQHAAQAIGILMQAHTSPNRLKIPSFPVYTRSGEVRVTVAPATPADTRISPSRKKLVQCFMRFVFAEVLRVRRRGMTLQTEGSTHNNYYVVPTVKVQNPDGGTRVDIDWKFLEQIYQYTEEMKNNEIEKPMVWKTEDNGDDKTESGDKKRAKKMDNPLLKPGETFVFDAEKYKEAVVTPWYRNQDQPQFFLVAEICWNLTPDSAFPSATHPSFREYYSSKYGVALTQPHQPLLDVDHTSARLNLLTPRYVNRKGVALPVSSERTRRAKRDRLDQKQILVPELCAVHPFAAPLWFATVALPCVLYRINALLIADEIRREVAADVGLGTAGECVGTWPPLDFGWSLCDVLANNKEEPQEKEKEAEGKEEEKAEEQKEENTAEPKEKTINDILQEKEAAASGFEIGTWDNKMASSIPKADFDELSEPLPNNLTFCTSASGGANWCDPVPKPKSQFNPTRTFSMADSDCSYMSSDFDTDDSDLNSEGSDDETDSSGFCSYKSNTAMGVRIEYKTAHEAEAVDLERRPARPAPAAEPRDDERDRGAHASFLRAGDLEPRYLEKFQKAVESHKQDIINQGLLIEKDKPIIDLLPESAKELRKAEQIPTSLKKLKFEELFPYKNGHLNIENGVLSLENIEKNKRLLLEGFKKTLTKEEIKKLTCFSMIDVDIDSPEYKNEKISNIGFDTVDSYIEKAKSLGSREFTPYFEDGKGQNGKEFDFDYQPNLEGHPGPSPSVILQALTMSNANDGINLERLETIGDSFLKFAITAYLYCAQPTVHEGKLSHMRSKQVSNLNLYRLGAGRGLGARMTASKFEPHDNWLPPAHRAPPAAHAPVDSEEPYNSQEPPPPNTGCFIPYNLITQHSIPDKSIADCVEALIGAYLLECGPRGALLFMAWLGIKVLPSHDVPITDPEVIAKLEDAERQNSRRRSNGSGDEDDTTPTRPVGSLAPRRDDKGQWVLPMFGELKAPPSPLLRYIEDPEGELEQMLSGYDALERTLQYRFRDRSLLLQALTHASHQRNRLTDCYQRLEFLGDAVLDYLITRHLYEDPRRHSPGALTDLRSALVNNTIFATLAARHSFHKYFRHMSPGLNEVLTKYVKIQEENGHSISEEHYLIHEDELEQAEDVEVPKALGDLFESVAGAIFLDSGMSLAAVWRSYELLMGAELDAFSAAAPKSPVRELLEAEPDTAKFGKPERLADGRRVRVCVEVFGRGTFKGVGRNYRIAKGTAARCALRHLRRHKH